MSIIRGCLILLLLAGSCFAQCGLAFNPLSTSNTSANVIVPTNYTSTTAPSVGTVTTDPDFGCKYWPISFGTVHEYSAMAVIDSNDRWVVTIPTSAGGITTPAVIRDIHTGATVCTVTGVGQGLRWGINDPDILWYMNNATNQLQLYSVTTHTSSLGSFTACTMTTYDSSISTSFTALSNCFGESDTANKSGHDVLCLSNDANHDSHGASVRFYDTATKTLGPALTGGTSYYYGTQCVDYGDMTQVNGNILLDYNGLTVASGCVTRDTNTSHQYGGIDVFNGTTGAWISTVQNFGCGHGARGIDADGSEIIVCNNFTQDATPPANCDNGIIKTRISDGTQTCILTYDFNLPAFPPGTTETTREQLTAIHNPTGAHHMLLVTHMDFRGEANNAITNVAVATGVATISVANCNANYSVGNKVLVTDLAHTALNGVQTLTGVTSTTCTFNTGSPDIASVADNGWAGLAGTMYRGPNNNTAVRSDYASVWGKVYNELYECPLGGGNCNHLVHHRGNWIGTSGVQYWSGTHGSISRSGNYVAYDSVGGVSGTWPTGIGTWVAQLSGSSSVNANRIFGTGRSRAVGGSKTQVK